MLGFKQFRNAVITIAGIELMHRIRKGQFGLWRLRVQGGTALEIRNAIGAVHPINLSPVILAGLGGSQSLGCKLDESLDQRRNVSAARIHGIKAANRRRANRNV
jgi:hypothetical protein